MKNIGEAIGQTLAHEMLFHTVAGETDITGSIDPTDVDGGGGFRLSGNRGKEFTPGATMSKSACEEICKELDLK